MQVPSPLRSLGRGQWIWWRLHRGGVGASTVTQSSPEASESKKLIRDGIKVDSWDRGVCGSGPEETAASEDETRGHFSPTPKGQKDTPDCAGPPLATHSCPAANM